MKFDDLLDLTLREIIEGFCLLYSPDCDCVYGVMRYDDWCNVDQAYDFEDSNAIEVLPILSKEVTDYGSDEVLEWSDVEKVLKSLGINKKEK